VNAKLSGRWQGDALSVTIQRPDGFAVAVGKPIVCADPGAYSVGTSSPGSTCGVAIVPTLDEAIELAERILTIGPGSVLWAVVQVGGSNKLLGSGEMVHQAMEEARSRSEAGLRFRIARAYVGVDGWVELFDTGDVCSDDRNPIPQ